MPSTAVPREIHAELTRRGVLLCLRTVTNLLDRYDELLALSLADTGRLRRVTAAAGRVILAIDGLQPDVGHEVLWVLRDCLSGEIRPPCDPEALAGSSPPTVGWCRCSACVRPFFADPLAEFVRELIQIPLTLADGLEISSQNEGHVRDSPMPELGGFDGRISPLVFFRERVVEQTHRVLDRWAVCHVTASVPRF
jgi:hypothetical protein